MMKPKSAFFRYPIASLVGAALLLPVLGLGALTWQTQLIELTSRPGDKEAIGLFYFENSGKATVTITSVQPSCGCTTAELEKRTYAPGESGKIKAVFTLGDRVGEQEKVVYVVTDDPSVRPVSLVLHVMIPEYLNYTPRLLMWNVGEATVDKITTLSANGKLRITSVALASPAPSEVTSRVEPVEPGVRYRLYVRPASTAKVMNTPLAGVATFADGTTQPFKVYVLVR